MVVVGLLGLLLIGHEPSEASAEHPTLLIPPAVQYRGQPQIER